MINPLKKLNLPNSSSAKFFFVLYFIILTYAFLFTLILKHFIPSLHAGHGLLIGDNILFHNTAVDMAGRIASSGWSEWKVFSLNTAATINVGIASIVYYFLGPNPAFLLPINAFFQTVAAYLLFKIVSLVSSNKKVGYVSAALFSLMPTTLIWTSQLHKDGYSVVAYFLILLVALSPNDRLSMRQKIILHMIGMGILYVTRPLFMNLIFLILILDFCYILFARAVNLSKIINFINLIISAFFILSFYYFKPVVNANSDAFDASGTVIPQTSHHFQWSGGNGPIDKLFLKVASLRVNLVYFSGSEPTSLIDGSVLFESKKDFVNYFPRALFVALFLPDPLFLTKIGNKQSYGLVLEILIYYFFLLNLIYYLIRQKLNHTVNRVILVALIGGLFQAYMCPVLGSLHRGRYPFFCLLISLGVTAFFVHWQKYKNDLPILSRH